MMSISGIKSVTKLNQLQTIKHKLVSYETNFNSDIDIISL